MTTAPSAPPLPAALAMFNLTGRTALITGSGSGIGLALARGLLSAGASVVLNGRNTDKLNSAASELRAQCGDPARVLTQAFDATDGAAVQAGVSALLQRVGHLDILINNAGMTFRTPLEQFPADTWHAIMRTNVDSAFYVSQTVAHGMIARGAGKIVNICSVQSELGRPGTAPYMASKGALKMLTKGMAVDWGKHGLQVNGLGPGYFKTELTQALVNDDKFSAWLTGRTPANRWGNVEDLVGATIFLCSDASQFVNGHILYVDGGLTASM